jgi:hypothetical protein
VADVFISYAREDGAAAQELSRQLQQAGFSVFLDVERMRAGSFPEQIDRAIARCDVFVLLLSPASVRSTYVQRELHDAADEHLKPVLPVMLAEADLTPVRLTIAGLQRVPYAPDRPDTIAAVVEGIHRLAASKRRERRERRGPAAGDRHRRGGHRHADDRGRVPHLHRVDPPHGQLRAGGHQRPPGDARRLRRVRRGDLRGRRRHGDAQLPQAPALTAIRGGVRANSLPPCVRYP